MRHFLTAAALLILPGTVWATTADLVLGTRDFLLAGGAGFIPGHGAPTGVSLRTGSPGQKTAASFPRSVFTPGATITEISFSYRYISGYGPAGYGHGSNISLYVSDEPLQIGGTLLYSSPHYTDYAYAANNSNYSAPVNVHLSGLSVPASKDFTTRLQFGFWNNDRNLQILIPISMNVTCAGVDNCFAPVPKPTTLPPLPPAPIPPATNTPWKNIGPWNIGDDIHNGGEAGTIAPAVSSIASPNIMYMGGNNNAASSGVLKTVDYGKHWSKVNNGLFDTRINGMFMVDDKGDHVLVGTFSGVFETLDGGESWTHIKQSQGWGVANSFRNGTINGKSYILIGANAGLGNVPFLKNQPLVNQTWNLIPSPRGHSAWRTNTVSVGDFDRDGKPLQNSVVGGCIWVGGHGVVHIATLTSVTSANWTVQLDQPCQSLAIDPNNADHFIVNNASNGAHIYETFDGGKSYHGCLNKRGAVMVAIDRQGWFYCASEGGAFRNMGGCVNGTWEPYFVRRIARRDGRVRDRSAHDYQRINIDFAGGVAFGSDQGMFVKNGSELQLYSANGDLNNNIIMHPAIAEGEVAGETCIVTAVWDWAPIASWDSGKHWPSWGIPDDGAGMGYFGEGGGCFGVGKSKNVLCMHHHNVAYSSRCGKNMSRLVVPHGASVAGPSFTRKAGSRSEPAGPVYAMMTMGRPPWDTLTDKSLVCEGAANRGDLGVHTQHSCLSHVDIGLEYNWYPGVNVAVWRGDTNKHCYLCTLTGNSSSWDLRNTTGAIVYVRATGAEDKVVVNHEEEKRDFGGEYLHNIRTDDEAMARFHKHMEKTRKLEMNEVIPPPSSGLDIHSTGNPQYVLKSMNFGANWTWIMLPQFLQGLHEFSVDPTNATTLYGITGNCIGRSYDQAVTWEYCWQAQGLTGSFKSLLIKDSKTMIMVRNGDVPLRTRDGGVTWKRLGSLANLARYGLGAAYSWSGKTLAISTVRGRTLVWVSRDDGDTWVDESGDYTALNGGIAQWYDNTLYISSMGQGISAKVFKED